MLKSFKKTENRITPSGKMELLTLESVKTVKPKHIGIQILFGRHRKNHKRFEFDYL